MTENKNQQINPFLEDRIKNQQLIISQLEEQLSTEYKILNLLQPNNTLKDPAILSDTISDEQSNRRIWVKPEIADDAVIYVLQNCVNNEQGLTNPEIERLIFQEKKIIISKNGVQSSLDRLLEKKSITQTNPNQLRNKRYIIKKEDRF